MHKTALPKSLVAYDCVNIMEEVHTKVFPIKDLQKQ